MRVASVRVVQHRLTDVLAWVEAGEEVQITRRNKVVARLLPPQGTARKIDFAARRREIFEHALPADQSVSALIIADRDER